MSFTTVIGVDAYTFPQLKHVWPTWKAHKRCVTDGPMVVFYDKDQVSQSEIEAVLGSTLTRRTFVPWPPEGAAPYPGDGSSKWTNPQRAKMLAGFVHVAAVFVDTEYWLKLDLDTVATGKNEWVNPEWFKDRPVIVAPSWGYTKPADQMTKLDKWVEDNAALLPAISTAPPLNLHPNPGSSLVKHTRIASWCAFFSTSFTRLCSQYAKITCGVGHLPVPSQDGYQWYVAKRGRFVIANMDPKRCGWICCANTSRVESTVKMLSLGES